MKDNKWHIDNASEALLFCDYLARFGADDVSKSYEGLANVIRDLMHRVERQALQIERDEARNDSAR